MSDLVRWVRLKLRKESGDELQKDSEKALGGVERGLGRVKAAAAALGAAIAGAFAVSKLIDFGRAAVAEAMQGEREWSKLGSTIQAAGEDFAALRPEIDAASKAFQDATVYGAGDYLQALDRMVSLTGDVSASTYNMGLVADVAAQFFDGELAPAADLVAKAMNGNTAALGKMGIQAGSAQEALQILADRSMGAAAARAGTISGQLSQLNERWMDFLDAVGAAILAGDGLQNGLSVIRAALEVLTGWVTDNADAISRWVTGSIRFAIDAADVLLRALLGIAQLVRGGLNTSLAIGALAISTLAEGYVLALRAASKFLSFIGAKETADGLDGFADMVGTGAEKLREFAAGALAAGGEQVQSGLGFFSNRLFSSDQFANAPRGSAAAAPGGAPRVGRNAKPEEAEEEEAVERLETRTDRVVRAVEEFGHAMDNNRRLAALLGEDFDALAAEASTLEGSIAALIAEGVEPTDPLLTMMRDRLREVRGEMELLEDATRMEEEAMRAQGAAAAELASALGAAMDGGLGPFAKGKSRQNLLEAAELTLRAGAAALTGFGAARVPAFLGLAAKHAGLAAAWGALGAVSPGGVPSGSAGMTPGAARGASSAAAGSVTPGNDVQIFLTGPGFNALNPEVQKVVRGAYEQSTERQGNARVRVITREG